MIPHERIAARFAKDDAVSESRRIHGHSKSQAEVTLVIHFTPRSGSSWLASLLAGSQRLGTGFELFNPDFIPSIAQVYGARSLEEYIELARHFGARGGVMSFEIVSHQLNAVFRDRGDFFTAYRGCPSFWLIREDIVAQAVSLAKMVRTKIGHATQTDAAARRAADDAFSYDREEISRWLRHILAAERLSEQWFAEFGVSPTRLSYERLVATPPHDVLAEFSRAAGQPSLPANLLRESPHHKIGTHKNVEFADRFRQQHSEWLAEVEHERSAWVAKAAAFPTVG